MFGTGAKLSKMQSSDFNYYQWNTDRRKNAARHIKSDTRVQPRAEEPWTSSLRFVSSGLLPGSCCSLQHSFIRPSPAPPG
jgi:hypothetical protein